MPKFTASERMRIQNLVCNLSIKRIPDNEIIKEVYEQTKKTISKVTIFHIRKRIKKESAFPVLVKSIIYFEPIFRVK